MDKRSSDEITATHAGDRCSARGDDGLPYWPPCRGYCSARRLVGAVTSQGFLLSDRISAAIQRLDAASFAAALPPTDNVRILAYEIEQTREFRDLAEILADEGAWEALKTVIAVQISKGFHKGSRFPGCEALIAILILASASTIPIARSFVSELARLRETVEFGPVAQFACDLQDLLVGRTTRAAGGKPQERSASDGNV